jgi:hypothetical protein
MTLPIPKPKISSIFKGNDTTASTNNKIHNYKTRNNNNLHLPIADLSRFNKGPYISGIKVFNHLPQYIKALIINQTYFKSTLKMFLHHHSFYSMNIMNIRRTEEYKP